MQKRLFLVDAHALIFRSYYALLGRPMHNAEGLNTATIFGFTKFLRDIIRREQPHYLGVAFDPRGGNFRHELYPQYKANRSETPEEIIAAIPYIKEILEALRIPVLEIPGYEADDVIGTLSHKASREGFEVFMVTPDKDYGQLVGPNVHIYKQRKGEEGIEIVGVEQIKANYGVDDPHLIIDILALWGDASDNIPGVPGIGEKGAVKLVGEHGTVEQILALARTEALKGKVKENLLAGADQLLLSKRLATIDINVPVAFEPEALAMKNSDCDRLRDLFRRLNFNMFLRELEGGGFISTGNRGNAEIPEAMEVKHSAPLPAKKMRADGQGSLFGDDTLFLPTTAPTDAEGGETRPEEYKNITHTPHQYHIIRDEAELSALTEKLRTRKIFCFDTETTGFDIFNDRLVGISFAVEAHEAYYLPCNKENTERWLNMLKPVFEDATIEKIGQNLKFDLMVLRSKGVEVQGFKYDTMLLHYLLNPESRHNMDFLARNYLGYSPIGIETLIGRGAKQLTMDRIAVEACAEYAAEDADITLQLKEVLWKKIVEEGFETLYRSIEEPLIDVLAEMEMNGVRIDTEILRAYGKNLQEEIIGLEAKIRALSGEPHLNINSPKQLGDVLFEKLKIDSKPKRTKTRQYKTDEESLKALSDRHPIVGLILEYRGIKKLLSTYAEALPQLVNPLTGRVHTSFNQAVTATGRLSSNNPNLQNIPIRDAQGREIRKAFVPADGEHLLLSADYNQVELRLMASLSGDPALLHAFRQGEDIHTATAARVFGIPDVEVSPEQRRKAKMVNFGIIYGISAFGLAQRLDIPRTEAAGIIANYFTSYPRVRQYIEETIERARERGYVETGFGRKRFLPDIRSGNATVRGLAERNAINAPIQGGAADVMKLAMIGVWREFRRRGFRSRMILQVHDELVVDLYKPEREEVVQVVNQAMEQAAKLQLPLVVDVGVGKNWIEAH